LKRRLFLSAEDILVLAEISPRKEQMVLFLEAFLKHGNELVTSFHVLEKVLSAFHEKNRISNFRNYISVLESLITEIIRPDMDDLYKSIDIMELYGISMDVSMDCAICINRRIYLPEWHPGRDVSGQSVIKNIDIL
jgi:hypothetical protein